MFVLLKEISSTGFQRGHKNDFWMKDIFTIFMKSLKSFISRVNHLHRKNSSRNGTRQNDGCNPPRVK